MKTTILLLCLGLTLSSFLQAQESSGSPQISGYPQMQHTGDVEHDIAQYNTAKTAWIAAHPAEYDALNKSSSVVDLTTPAQETEKKKWLEEQRLQEEQRKKEQLVGLEKPSNHEVIATVPNKLESWEDFNFAEIGIEVIHPKEYVGNWILSEFKAVDKNNEVLDDVTTSLFKQRELPMFVDNLIITDKEMRMQLGKNYLGGKWSVINRQLWLAPCKSCGRNIAIPFIILSVTKDTLIIEVPKKEEDLMYVIHLTFNKAG